MRAEKLKKNEMEVKIDCEEKIKTLEKLFILFHKDEYRKYCDFQLF